MVEDLYWVHDSERLETILKQVGRTAKPGSMQAIPDGHLDNWRMKSSEDHGKFCKPMLIPCSILNPEKYGKNCFSSVTHTGG